MSAENRLTELGIELFESPPPLANYIRAKRFGNLLFVAGHHPPPDDSGKMLSGKVGADFTVEEAYQIARRTGRRLLGSVRREIGSLDRVKSILKVNGFVNAAPGFGQSASVINGCSDLFTEIFGEEIGKHPRTACCVANLGGNAPLEIEMIMGVD